MARYDKRETRGKRNICARHHFRLKGERGDRRHLFDAADTPKELALKGKDRAAARCFIRRRACSFRSDVPAPRYVSWSAENRSQLVRIPAAANEFRRAELRSPDPLANPYIAFTLLIRAGLDGLKNRTALPAPVDVNMFKADAKTVSRLAKLPETIADAKAAAKNDGFIKASIPARILDIYCAD